MTDGKISDNEAKQGGGIFINDTDAAAYLLGGTIQDNKATDGYPHYDDASERSYYGNAVYQDGSLYLDGTKANISGDIRIGCRFDTSGGISTNRFVALVGASDTMNDYELTSFKNESLDGRVVVAPGAITYGTETYSVADAEPYLSHFTHNHKEIITDTDYTAKTGTSSQAKSLVLYGAIQKFSVTYTDGIGGTSFADEVTSDLHRGTPTPAFTGGTPTRSGYTFTGWEPSVAATVTGNAVYTAQWAKNSSSSHHSTRYTLHYESNGGTAYKDERCSSGTKVTLDKTPTRESYTFTGWYADAEDHDCDDEQRQDGLRRLGGNRRAGQAQRRRPFRLRHWLSGRKGAPGGQYQPRGNSNDLLPPAQSGHPRRKSDRRQRIFRCFGQPVAQQGGFHDGEARYRQGPPCGQL